jgi:hypothetical protein
MYNFNTFQLYTYGWMDGWMGGWMNMGSPQFLKTNKCTTLNNT